MKDIDSASTAPIAQFSTARHFQAIVESSEDAIISKSLTGSVMSWNKAAQKLFGYTAIEMVGEPMHILLPADRMHEEDFILKKVLSGDEIVHFETQRLHKDGHFLILSVSVSPIFDAKGKVTGASMIARDISERHQFEILIRQYEAIVRSSDDAIIGKSLSGIITSWNRGATLMFGYSAEEMIGQSMSVLLPAERSREEATILARIKLGGKVDHFETVRRCKDGRHIDVSVTISPIRDSAGRVVGASKIARDISAQKIASNRLLLTSSVFTNTSCVFRRT